MPDAAYHCPWCGQPADPAALSCPACGSAVDVRLATSDSGWTELPGVRDMAKIQFGSSTCQIEGKMSRSPISISPPGTGFISRIIFCCGKMKKFR